MANEEIEEDEVEHASDDESAYDFDNPDGKPSG